jgi:hypothetical protein
MPVLEYTPMIGHHYRVIYSQVFICLGLISLALYPHDVNKFVLIASYLCVAIVLSQHQHGMTQGSDGTAVLC